MSSFDPYAYEVEEARDAARFYTGPDSDRPDPSEYMDPPGLYLTRRLDCGHTVSAGEDSGGMDELPYVTMAEVERLLAFKIFTHNCGRFEAAERIRAEGRPFG